MADESKRTKFSMEMLIQDKQIHMVFENNNDRDEFINGMEASGVIGNPRVIKSN